MDENRIYKLMQRTVDTIPQSEHPHSKVAATLAKDANQVSAANYWPAIISKRIGRETRIGNASGTIHAETAVMLSFPQSTQGASLFVTDPPCPNCVKNLAEAGIQNLYIDHKGFDKDFAQRRGEDFEQMSMQLCEHAGINVYKVWRKKQQIETILKIEDSYTPPLENPALLESFDMSMEWPASAFPDFLKRIREYRAATKDEMFAACIAVDSNQKAQFMAAAVHPVLGFRHDDLPENKGKYSFIQQPVNRLLALSARHDLKIFDGFLYTSQTPTSRELVNLVGAEITDMHIENIQKCRDPHGLEACKMLQISGVMHFYPVTYAASQ